MKFEGDRVIAIGLLLPLEMMSSPSQAEVNIHLGLDVHLCASG